MFHTTGKCVILFMYEIIPQLWRIRRSSSHVELLTGLRFLHCWRILSVKNSSPQASVSKQPTGNIRDADNSARVKIHTLGSHVLNPVCHIYSVSHMRVFSLSQPEFHFKNFYIFTRDVFLASIFSFAKGDSSILHW